MYGITLGSKEQEKGMRDANQQGLNLVLKFTLCH